MHFEQIADSDTVSTYQVISVKLVTNKKLEDLVHLRQAPFIDE